jgi:hypothetical protein
MLRSMMRLLNAGGRLYIVYRLSAIRKGGRPSKRQMDRPVARFATLPASCTYRIMLGHTIALQLRLPAFQTSLNAAHRLWWWWGVHHACCNKNSPYSMLSFIRFMAAGIVDR